MLKCRYALAEPLRNQARIASLVAVQRPVKVETMNAVDPGFSELKAAEEARRDKCWDPQERWKVLQATIAWAESQGTVRHNERSARLREQAIKLAAWAAWEQRG